MNDDRTPPAAPLGILLTATGDEDFYALLGGAGATGGVFFATPSPPPIGTEVRLRIALANAGVLRADGTVRWTRAAEEGGVPGCSIAWHATEGRSLAVARRYLESRDRSIETAPALAATGS